MKDLYIDYEENSGIDYGEKHNCFHFIPKEEIVRQDERKQALLDIAMNLKKIYQFLKETINITILVFKKDTDKDNLNMLECLRII